MFTDSVSDNNFLLVMSIFSLLFLLLRLLLLLLLLLLAYWGECADCCWLSASRLQGWSRCIGDMFREVKQGASTSPSALQLFFIACCCGSFFTIFLIKADYNFNLRIFGDMFREVKQGASLAALHCNGSLLLIVMALLRILLKQDTALLSHVS